MVMATHPRTATRMDSGTWLVHRTGNPPATGVIVWHYPGINVWECERHGTASRTTKQDCGHVRLAQAEKEGRTA